METILFFTNPVSLDQVGVHPDWDAEVDPIIFQLIDHQHEVWLASDMIKLNELKQIILERVPGAIFWVYHSLPKTPYIRGFKKFLEKHHIHSENLQESAMYYGDSIYVPLNKFYSLGLNHFDKLKQRIQKMEIVISKMIAPLSNRKKFLKSPPNVCFYPAALRDIYYVYINDIDDKNFELRKEGLRDALNDYLINYNLTNN